MALDDKAISDIMQAMEEYELLTGGCVRFRPRTEADGINFVFYTSAFSGCFAKIGKAIR